MLLDKSEAIKTRLRRFILAGAIVYVALVLYFMFFGFNRIDQKIDYNQYIFMLVPERVPLRYPELTILWVCDFSLDSSVGETAII